jgi:Asp-tRNA(Asn)/Glu-tRNA(Gln) amidotransferase A subunit family amidase
MTPEVDAREAAERSLELVRDVDERLRAFVVVDEELVRAAANSAASEGGPLAGVTFGIKDIFDSGDCVTEYGSKIYADFRPRGDAAIAAVFKREGAVCIGKTVTTEFAMSHPGPTRNPHRLTHTPGGSSSGSAAGVATGMVDLAIGTQTGGSVIRPASYCGVFGYKPTFGAFPVAGMKPVAPSFDTPGLFARDPWLLDRARVALTGRRGGTPITAPPRLGVDRYQWDRLSVSSRDAVSLAVERAATAGATIVELSTTAAHDELVDQHEVVTTYEAMRSLAWEYTTQREFLSADLLERLAAGAAVDPDVYDSLHRLRRQAQAELKSYFGDVDAVLTASAVGEAPEGLSSTGDSRFCRLWTSLGLPAVTVPGLSGESGLPVGVQLVARHAEDAAAIAIASWLFPLLSGVDCLEPVRVA